MATNRSRSCTSGRDTKMLCTLSDAHRNPHKCSTESQRMQHTELRLHKTKTLGGMHSKSLTTHKAHTVCANGRTTQSKTPQQHPNGHRHQDAATMQHLTKGRSMYTRQSILEHTHTYIPTHTHTHTHTLKVCSWQSKHKYKHPSSTQLGTATRMQLQCSTWSWAGSRTQEQSILEPKTTAPASGRFHCTQNSVPAMSKVKPILLNLP